MSNVRMDGHVTFGSTADAARWLHSTGQTRARDERSVRGNVARAARGNGSAYGHKFEMSGE